MLHFVTWGLTGTVATEDPDLESDSWDVMESWIAEFDRSCNRFRPESELSRLNAAGAGTHEVSETLLRALVAARRSDELTDGLCDPTTLAALEALGYDRDFARLADVDVGSDGGSPRRAPGRAGWQLDGTARTVTLAEGTRLDLGASAKSLLCDIVAEVLAERGGALVELGGDVSARGRGPDGSWVIGVSARLEITGNESRIAPGDAGVATSSIEVRVWRRAGRLVNHIVDPRTGECADGPYVSATVVATNAVDANAAATASLLWGEDAPARLSALGVTALLTDRGHVEHVVGDWPALAVSTP